MIDLHHRGVNVSFIPVSTHLNQLFQSLRKNFYIFWSRAVAHQSDAPDFSFERPEAGTDFDIEIIVQTLPDSGVIDPFRNSHSINHRRANRFGYRGLELELAHRGIPFVKYGGLKFLESAHVKDVLAILKWADNGRNRMAGFRPLSDLRRWRDETPEGVAVRAYRSGVQPEQISFAEFAGRVERFAGALQPACP